MLGGKFRRQFETRNFPREIKVPRNPPPPSPVLLSVVGGVSLRSLFRARGKQIGTRFHKEHPMTALACAYAPPAHTMPPAQQYCRCSLASSSLCQASEIAQRLPDRITFHRSPSRTVCSFAVVSILRRHSSLQVRGALRSRRTFLLAIHSTGGWAFKWLNPPLCDIPSGCCSFTGPWTVTRSSLRMLRRVAAFCRPLRPVLLLVSFPRPGLC